MTKAKKFTPKKRVTNKFDSRRSFQKKKSPSGPSHKSSAPQIKNKPERIAKVLAHAGLCSRREAEQWILEGRVSVDGEVLKTPACVVSPINKITVNNRPFMWKSKQAKLWLYHKPTGYVVSNNDPQGRPTIFDILPKSLPRVVSVGRLDLNSEGLLLLTNDGGLARYLELPKNGFTRHYRVRVYGTVTEEIIERLGRGIHIDGVRYAPAVVEIDKVTGRNAWLFIKLTEGKNREIRKMMEHFGLAVNRLSRIGYGPFELRDLGAAKAKEISEDQLHKLLPGYFGE